MSHNLPLHETLRDRSSAEMAAMDQTLADLGVHDRTLTMEQCNHLDMHGFLLLPGHMDASALSALRSAHERLMLQKYGQPRVHAEPSVSDFWHHEVGTRRLADLVSEDPVFDRLYIDPMILAAAARIFQAPFKLDSINAREALPGHGHQHLHRDNAYTAAGEEPGVNTAWLLDDFSQVSGSTRVVPGSHRFCSGPEVLADSAATHPDEHLILAPAGSVMIFRNTLWHGGTQNRSAHGRRVIHVSFRRREIDLGDRAQHLRIRLSTWQRISPAARWLLQVEQSLLAQGAGIPHGRARARP